MNTALIKLRSAQLLAALATTLSIGVAFFTFLDQSNIWPLPGFILLEIIILSSYGFVITTPTNHATHEKTKKLIWAVCGALTTLIIVSVLSIGLLLLPTLFAFLLVAFLVNDRMNQSMLANCGMNVMIYSAGFITNAAFVFLLIILSNFWRSTH